ncbi:hypothetical protein ACSBR2_003767 [Camellia fascicularis]
MLFLNGLPEARFEKRAIRLTGCGLCHDGNTNPDFTGAPSLTIQPICKSGYQACGHQYLEELVLPEGISLPAEFWAEFSREHTHSTILISVQEASISPGYTELVLIDFVGSEIQFKGNQCSFTRGRVKRSVRHRPPVQQLPAQWSLNSQVEIYESTAEIDISVIQLDQGSMSGLEEMVRQLQESMKNMQQDAVRQAEFAKQQAVVMAQQAELITKLQQQAGASVSHQDPPPPRVPILGEATNVQDDTDIPVGPPPPPILPQLSKVPTPINLPDSPFEFEVDPTTLKVSKLEKLFKKSHGVKSIPDIEDGYTDVAVTLPDRFKMPHIDRFDRLGDPMVYLSLFSDVLRPMGLTRLQKLSLFGRTLSGIAAIWYTKLEDSVKRSWEEMAEAFVAQYSYNTQIEITTCDLETTR